MPEFDGFQPEDFEALAGSTWRSRERLGGVLALALREQFGRPYQSWGVRRCLELHLAVEEDYDFDNPWPYAKLFVYTRGELAVGLYIETPAASNKYLKYYVHWQHLRDRLKKDPAMQTALLSAIANHNLILSDYYHQDEAGALGFQSSFRAGRLHWRRPGDPGWREVAARDLFGRIAGLPEDRWVNLHIFATMEVQSAIRMGPGVVAPILTVLRALVPVYEMTIAD
jgi:hypothetical protein